MHEGKALISRNCEGLMGLQPTYVHAGRGFALVALTCSVHAKDVPSVSRGGLQSEHLPSSWFNLSLESLPLLGCALRHSWESLSQGWMPFKQTINHGFLAWPLTQPQKGLSPTGVRGVQSPVPALPRGDYFQSQ